MGLAGAFAGVKVLVAPTCCTAEALFALLSPKEKAGLGGTIVESAGTVAVAEGAPPNVGAKEEFVALLAPKYVDDLEAWDIDGTVFRVATGGVSNAEALAGVVAPGAVGTGAAAFSPKENSAFDVGTAEAL